jgi:CheY-like chemotaxis protein
MSHEIRTPMNGVLGFAEMLRQSELDEHQEKYVELIEESGKIMMALLNDILDLSKIDAGLLILSPEPFELVHLLKGTRDMMLTAAENQNLVLNLEYADDLPKFVEHDKLRLRQILTNLIGNAIKFTKAGSVKIKAEVSAEDKNRFKISVIDTGIGIPEGRQRSIFDEFVQAEDDTDRSFGGTGLGLAISHKLVEMMGGTISLQSSVGSGSTFSIEIPSSACIDPRGEAGQPVDSADKQAAVPTVNRTILLVEDHEINRLLATAMLERMGCTVISAENGAKALEILTGNSQERHNFGLVLMDMQMPVMDGIESTRRIRQSGITAQQLPIIALTANAFSEDKTACAEAGMQDHVSKPIQFNDLYKAVCKWYSEPPSEARPLDPEVAEEDPTIALLRPKYMEFRARTLDRLFAGIGSIDNWSPKQSGEIQAMLHKLSGSAGAFSENEIAALAMQLEEAIRQGRSTDVLTSLAMQMLAYRRHDENVKAARA